MSGLKFGLVPSNPTHPTPSCHVPLFFFTSRTKSLGHTGGFETVPHSPRGLRRRRDVGDTSSFPSPKGALLNGTITANKRSLEGVCHSDSSESHHARRFTSSSSYRLAGAPSSVSSSRGNTLVGLSSQLFLSETYTRQQNASAVGTLGIGTMKCLCMNMHMGKANPRELRTRCWNL